MTHKCAKCHKSHAHQIGNLDETESLIAQYADDCEDASLQMCNVLVRYLVDVTLTDVQFLTERPR